MSTNGLIIRTGQRDFDSTVEDSIAVLLKAQKDNGAILASVGGGIYQHVYPRDTSRIVIAFDKYGYHVQARKLLAFLVECQLTSGEWSQCYTMEGKVPFHPFLGLHELDNNGLMIGALFHHYAYTRDRAWLDSIFPNIDRGIEYILHHYNTKLNLVWSMASIHEFPPWEAGYDIWVNSAICDGFRKASFLARELGKEKKAERWLDLSRKMKNSIWDNLWDEDLRYFLKRTAKVLIDPSAFSKIFVMSRKSIRSPFHFLSYLQYYLFAYAYLRSKSSQLNERELLIDISSFAPIYFKLTPLDDPKVEHTVSAIEELLWDPKIGGFTRYNEGVAPDPGGNNFLTQNGAGPWSIYTCWLAQHYIKTGEAEKAKRSLEWIVYESIKDGKMCEHISRHTGKRMAEDFVWGRAEYLLTIRKLITYQNGQLINRMPKLFPDLYAKNLEIITEDKVLTFDEINI